MKVLETKNIRKSFGDLEVLRGVDFSVAKREVVSIVGSSGAGKSTLLHILGTLDKPDQGQVFINGKDVGTLSNHELASFRNKEVGFIFQFHNLLPEFSALENICMPGFLAKEEESSLYSRALELMEILQIENRSSHRPSELSGGEQQRVAVARALINNPSIVFADEPSGNLDSKNAEVLHQLFFKLREALDQTFVIVTHNQELADMSDRKVEIKDGALI